MVISVVAPDRGFPTASVIGNFCSQTSMSPEDGTVSGFDLINNVVIVFVIIMIITIIIIIIIVIFIILLVYFTFKL
jgi:hypothetical protein